MQEYTMERRQECTPRTQGNINKQAGVKIGSNRYCLVQSNNCRSRIKFRTETKDIMQIWKRQENSGKYDYFCDAGLQVEIDLMAIVEKRDLIRRRVLETLAGKD
jgi:hypothetical protein